jgi:hypothetical protein
MHCQVRSEALESQEAGSRAEKTQMSVAGWVRLGGPVCLHFAPKGRESVITFRMQYSGYRLIVRQYLECVPSFAESGLVTHAF